MSTKYPQLVSQVQTALFRHLQHSYVVIDQQQVVLELSQKDNLFFKDGDIRSDISLNQVLHPVWVKEVSALLPFLTEQNPVHSGTVLDFEKDGERYYGEIELMQLDTPDWVLVLLKDRTSVVEAENEKERKFKALVENGMDAIVLLDANGSNTYVSPNIEQLLGYTEEEAMQLNLFAVLHPDDKAGVQEKWLEMLSKPGVPIKGEEARVRHKNGEWRWIEANIINMLHDPALQGIVDNFRDISDRKREAERTKKDQEELLHSNIMLAEAQKIAQLGYWEVDLLTREVSWTEAALAIWGRDKSQQPSIDFFYSTIHPDDKAEFIALNERCLNEGIPLDAVHRILLPDNTIKFVHERGTVVKDAEGRNIKFKGTTQDVTESKRNTEAVRLSNERFELVNRATSDAIWDWDLKSGTLYWGEGFTNLFGYALTDEKEQAARWAQCIHPQDRVQTIQQLNTCLQDPSVQTWSAEYRFQKADNSYAYVLDKGFMIRNEEGTAIRLIGAVQDITSAKEVARDLKEERNRMRAIIDNIPDYVVVKDRNGKQIVCNLAQQHLSGFDGEPTVPESFVLDEGEKQVLEEGIPTFNKEEDLFLSNGMIRKALTTKVPLKDESGNVVGLVGISRDITLVHKKQQEEKVLASITEAVLVGDNVKHSLELVLSILGEFLQANTGEAWLLNEAKLKLIRSAAWIPADQGDQYNFETGEFVYLTQHYLGDYWKRAEPAFHESQLPEPAKTGLIIPIPVQGHSVALLQFFFNQYQQPEEELLEFCSSLGSKMGVDIKTKKSEQELSLFFSHCPDPLWIASANGFFRKVNPAFLRLFGYEEAYVLSNPILSFIHPEDFSTALSGMENAFAGLIVESFECRFKTIDNIWKWLSWSTSELFYEESVVFGYGKDISDLKEAERNLVQFKKVLDTSRDGVAIYTPATKDSYMNQAMQQMLGFTVKEIAQMESPAVTYANKEQGDQMFKTILRGDYFTGDVQIVSKDENLLDLQLSAGPIYDEYGRVEAVYGIHMDISQRKQYLNEIIRVKQNLDALINNTGDMVWSYDTNLCLVVGNTAFIQHCEEIGGELIVEGSSILSEGFPVYLKEQWEPLYRKALEGEPFTNEQVLYNEKTGMDQFLFLSFTPMRNDAGDVVGAACFARDITELKRASRKLEELNHELLANAEELAASNADLERFAFIASHDLQEPLRMVSSFLQLLKQRYKGQLDDKADTYIDFAVDGATRMKSLIHGLLDYARVGSPVVDAVPIDLNLVIRDVQILLKTKMEENNAIVVSERLPVINQGNYTQLLQLFQNLLGNALKYRSASDPLVQVGVEDTGATWTIFIRDNGIGLDMRYADKIFLVFQRLHHHKTFTGAGIGLSICKRIVEKMGGKIWVESEPGKGSCFYFTIVK